MQKNRFRYEIPASLSWFSIDLYRTGTGGDHVAHLRNLYRTRIYPLLHDHQKVALIPGCFEKKGAAWDQARARDIRSYYRWAVEDERVVAMFPRERRRGPRRTSPSTRGRSGLSRPARPPSRSRAPSRSGGAGQEEQGAEQAEPQAGAGKTGGRRFAVHVSPGNSVRLKNGIRPISSWRPSWRPPRCGGADRSVPPGHCRS
jgi:hypothetical protein